MFELYTAGASNGVVREGWSIMSKCSRCSVFEALKLLIYSNSPSQSRATFVHLQRFTPLLSATNEGREQVQKPALNRGKPRP